MVKTKILMGMPVTVEIIGESSFGNIFNKIFSHFEYIDKKFSTYKKNSEITRLNQGKIKLEKLSDDMKTVLSLSNQTKNETEGFFDIFHEGKTDTSGLVKGWAILKAAEIIKSNGFKNFYVEAGGDIQTSGKNSLGKSWRVGIRNPFKTDEIVKVIHLSGEGIATSGTYMRGNHIYNPKNNDKLNDIVSLTVICPNVYDADRFATAAFAMGRKGIEFIYKLKEFAGFAIDKKGLATATTNFEKYT